MPITSMYEIMIQISGTPVNDIQATILYLSSIILSLLFIFGFLKMFQLIGGYFK